MGCYILDTATVVHNDDIKGRVFAAVPAPQEVASDAPKSVDRNLQLRHCLSPHSAGSANLIHATNRSKLIILILITDLAMLLMFLDKHISGESMIRRNLSNKLSHK